MPSDARDGQDAHAAKDSPIAATARVGYNRWQPAGAINTMIDGTHDAAATDAWTAQRMAALRGMAGVLAGLASFWALLLAPAVVLAMSVGNWLGVATLSAGYFVMAGYYWRALGKPTRRWCQAIWGWSLLVQASWLCITLVPMLRERPRLGTDAVPTVIVIGWWTVATAASIAGIFLEPAPFDAPKSTAA